MFFASMAKYADFGLLMIRLVIGVMFLYYGTPMLFGGPEKWAQVGGAMSVFHINFWFNFWGFLAGFTEFFGGICLILGLFFRPACLFLIFVMIVAASMHFSKGQGLFGAGHAIEDGAVFLGLFFVGPGRYSLDAMINPFL